MLEGINEADKPKVVEAINRLLAVNYLARELDRERYQLLRRHREAVDSFFKGLGWEFLLDERHECVMVKSPESIHNRRLTREESLWLLVLRLIYQEKRQGLTLSQFPMTTLYEIRTKYQTFRLPFPGKTKLAALVRQGKMYQLLEPLDPDIREEDCRFRLFHTWLYAVTAEDVTGLQELLQRYVLEGSEEGGDIGEVDEQAEVD